MRMKATKITSSVRLARIYDVQVYKTIFKSAVSREKSICNNVVFYPQSNDSSEEAMQRSNITADPSPSDITTDNENKHNSSEEAWTDVNLNEDGDSLPITNSPEDPRNIRNIANAHGKKKEH